MRTTAAFSTLSAVLNQVLLMSPFNARGQGDERWQAIVSRIHSSLQRGTGGEGCHPRWGLLVALPQSPAIMGDPLKRPSRKLRESRCDGFTSSYSKPWSLLWRNTFSQTDCSNWTQDKLSSISLEIDRNVQYWSRCLGLMKHKVASLALFSNKEPYERNLRIV